MAGRRLLCSIFAIFTLTLTGADNNLTAAQLKALGLEQHAQRAELGLAYPVLERRTEQLENLLLDALSHPDAPRPHNEEALFKACGCDSGLHTRVDEYAVPPEQKAKRFVRIAGTPGSRCVREEIRRLPAHDAELCGPVCYNKTMARLDPTAHESYTTLCPSPLIMNCEEREGKIVSICAFPNPGGKTYTLSRRVEDLVAGVLNYELNPNGAAEPAKLSLDFAPDFSDTLDKVENDLLHLLQQNRLSKPDASKQKGCGCVDKSLRPMEHYPSSLPRALGYVCDFDSSSQSHSEDRCGPVCVEKAGRIDTAFVSFCPEGMRTTCLGCEPPRVRAEEEMNRLRKENPDFAMEVPQYVREKLIADRAAARGDNSGYDSRDEL